MPERETPAGTMDDVDVVTRSVLTASRLLVGVSARSLAAVEERVTLPQFRMLVVLSTRGATKLVTLADLLRVAPSTAMRMVDRLIAAGLADRQANPGNRRETLLQLTEEGRRTVADVTARRRGAIAEIVERLTPTQRLALIEALAAFNEAGESLSLRPRTTRSRTRWGGRWMFLWLATPDARGWCFSACKPFCIMQGNREGSLPCCRIPAMRTVRACPAPGSAERSRAHQDGGVADEAGRGGTHAACTALRDRRGTAPDGASAQHGVGLTEFVGLPPLRLTAKGILAGCLAAVAIIGSTVAGAWYGITGLAAGEGGLVCAALLVLYLCGVRAGRALVGAVAVLAVGLALQTPQAAAGFVLAERGRPESVVVVSVEGASADAPGSGRYLCSVLDRDGVPMKLRIWRGCEQTTRPGDAITVVYDVEGRVPPRGAEGGGQPLTP